MSIIQRVPWRAQPQYPVRVDWSNPITRDLNLLVTPGVHDREIALSGAPVSAIYGKGAGTVRGSGALAYVGDGSTNNLTYPRDRYKFSGANSVFSICLPTTLTGSNRGLLSKNGATLIPINHGIEGATGRVFNYYSSATPDRYWTTNLLTVSVNALHFIGLKAPALAQSTPRFFINGSFENGTDRGGTLTGTVADPTDADVAVGNYSAAGGKFAGSIFLCAAWKRELSDAEFLSLYDNPWQLFAQTRRIWVTGAAAGGTTFLPTPPRVILQSIQRGQW